MSVPSDSLITSTVPCAVCGNNRVELAGTLDRDGKPLQSVMCPRCGLVWNDPRPSAEELRQYYREQYRQDYKQTAEPKPKHTVRAARVACTRCAEITQAFRPKDEILDLGAGGGEVVYVLQRLGYKARGIEPNEGYARFARERLGASVESGFWQEAPIPAGSVDAVTLFHVLEHIDQPLEAISLIRKWLRPGGLLWIEVPCVEATCQAPIHRFHRAHLYNFNPGSLAALGRRAGYDVERTFTSADGGNVTAVLRRSETPPPATIEVPGNADRIRSVLQSHTNVAHFLKPAPYVRPVRKILERMSESRAVKAGKDAKSLIDNEVDARLASGRLKRVNA